IRGPLGRDRGAPSGSKSGRAEKAHNGRFTGATHLSLLSAKTAGISGHNRATQAELSTYDWYAFAGHVNRPNSLLTTGTLSRGTSTGRTLYLRLVRFRGARQTQ